MTTVAPARETVDLDHVDVAVTVRRSLLGASEETVVRYDPSGVSLVDTEAVLLVFDDEDDDAGPERRTIGKLHGKLIDIDRVGGDLIDVICALDWAGGEAFSVAEEALTEATSFAEELADVRKVLIVETLTIDERYRGQGLGPRLLHTTANTLDGEGYATLVLLRAEPFNADDMDPDQLKAVRKKLAKSYKRVGFKKVTGRAYYWHTALTGAESLGR